MVKYNSDNDIITDFTINSVFVRVMYKRINFAKEKWYEQFLTIREGMVSKFLSKPNINDAYVHDWIIHDDGYSVANLTYEHAVISNVCINAPYDGVYVHDKDNSIWNRTLKYSHINHMYCKHLFKFLLVHHQKKCLSINAPAKNTTHNQVMYLILRYEKNIFHTFEGLSPILRLVAHPEHFPTIKQMIIHKEFEYPPESWTSVVEELLLSLLHESIRPAIVPETSFCEKVLVLGGSWRPYGYGSFIPEPMIADMFRAVVYKYIDWKYREPVDGRLSAFLLQRGGRRQIMNSNAIYDELIKRYNSSISLQYFSLDNATAMDQMKLFSSLDIAIHPHGAASTNMIFMLPKSYLLEIFPPHFYYDCFEKLSIGLEVIYDHVVSPGRYPEFCIKQKITHDCPRTELRNRKFYANIRDIIVKLDSSIPLVRQRKYPFLWK